MKQIKSIAYVYRVTSEFMSIYTEAFELPVNSDWYSEAKKIHPSSIAINLSYKYNIYTDGTHD